MAYIFEFVKINLKGEVTFYKYNPPKIYFELNNYALIEKKFIQFYEEKYYLINGFNKDKYIIIEKSDKKEIYKEILIYNSGNLKLLCNKENIHFIKIKKINDNYFFMVTEESQWNYNYNLFYYDETKMILYLIKYFIKEVFIMNLFI